MVSPKHESEPMTAEPDPRTLDAQPSEGPYLLREDQEGVTVLTLNRPKSRNSLSRAMLLALKAELDDLASASEVKAIVLSGAPPAFCAGHDLREMTAHRQDADRGRAFFEETMQLCSNVMMSVMTSPKPVVAAVEGIATAAGCQLVASCDLAVASSEARFATPGVNIGLFCSTPMVALSRNVSRKHAMEMLLLGEMIGAERAAAMGLVNRTVTPGEAVPAAAEMASIIASKSGPIVKIGKEAFYRQLEMPVAEAYAYASRVMTENMLARDAEEGIGAFLEKRPPRWSDAT